MAETQFDSEPVLREMIQRLDERERRVRRRSMYLTVVPLVSTILCLTLISVLVPRAMRRLDEADQLRVAVEAESLKATNRLAAITVELQKAELQRSVAEAAAADAEQRRLVATTRAVEAEQQRKVAEDAREAANGLRLITAETLEQIQAEAERTLKLFGSARNPALQTLETTALRIDEVAAALPPRSTDVETTTVTSGGRGMSPTSEGLIRGLYSPQASTRIRAYESVMSRQQDPRLIPELLAIGNTELSQKPLNVSGIYNTLVVLSHVRSDRITPYRAQVRQFANAAAKQGVAAISDRARTLLSRLP